MPHRPVSLHAPRGSVAADVIREGIVDGVINTPGPADKEILDGLEIRRAAVAWSASEMTLTTRSRFITAANPP